MSRVELILTSATFSPSKIAHTNPSVLAEMAEFFNELNKILKIYGSVDILSFLRYQEENVSTLSQAKYPTLFFVSQAFAIQYTDGKYRNLVSKSKPAEADQLLAQVLTVDDSSSQSYQEIRINVTKALTNEHKEALKETFGILKFETKASFLRFNNNPHELK